MPKPNTSANTSPPSTGANYGTTTPKKNGSSNRSYVDFENDPVGDTRERLQAMNYTPEDLDNLKLLSFPTLSALDSAKGSEELMAAVRYYQAQVVVIDTVSRAVKGDENENNTWLDFYRMTGLKLKAAGVALIRLDHTGKDQTKGQRGGSAKAGDVDAIWHMTKIDEDTVQLRLDASRFSMPPEMKLLLLHRKEKPFRHEVDPNGPRAAFDIKVKKLVEEMDRLNLPKTWGRDKLTQALRDANSQVPRGDTPMREAIKRRKTALTPLVQVISTEQDTA
jgi:RecA-family ATPase